ncbi:uncharacterized protein BDZ99DRAFT_75938 [Mytilinidion resinicola]|uniref:Uncharacterized protein n=1 Tax=Mytilinidion resinicola TaxID=574789 RepID=A0A6A6YEN7_9PEZI|nr:uncharacterized protein BDZ99DRAFT_75938 [Mytilinidion resinicola]KAF2807200.1 hypothetical protein BDZ99DRAFT_75938 [Mytilinidion resinicola]
MLPMQTARPPGEPLGSTSLSTNLPHVQTRWAPATLTCRRQLGAGVPGRIRSLVFPWCFLGVSWCADPPCMMTREAESLRNVARLICESPGLCSSQHHPLLSPSISVSLVLRQICNLNSAKF